MYMNVCDTQSNNKRIAKNTFLLYVRMLLVMGISLYTVRVVLYVLGEEDYGIYSVVGGIVLMFSFLNSSLASASQRFFAFELGRNDLEKLGKIFGAMLFFYVIVCFVLLILVEVCGVWLLNEKLNIPASRMYAANIVLQFSILTFIIRMINTPFQAIIIANEKMNVYALVGILEVLFQFVIVQLLKFSSGDCLVQYAILITINVLITSLCYILYAKHNFKECTLKPIIDKKIIIEICKYSSWMMVYGFSEVAYIQGINMLLNIFFNATVNAARAIAYQVYGAIKLFGLNFFKAVEPQMTKLYSNGELNRSFSLLIASSKYSFYLILVLSLPIITHASFVLHIWLGEEIPNFTVPFTQLMLIDAMIGILGNPLGTMSRATGRIGKYSIIISLMYLINLPISYLFLKLGYSSICVFWIMILLCAVTILLRIILLKDQICDFSILRYLNEVIRPVLYICLFSSLIYIIFSHLCIDDMYGFILSSLSIVTLTLIGCFFLGLSALEKKYAIKYAKHLFKRTV